MSPYCLVATAVLCFLGSLYVTVVYPPIVGTFGRSLYAHVGYRRLRVTL